MECRGKRNCPKFIEGWHKGGGRILGPEPSEGPLGGGGLILGPVLIGGGSERGWQVRTPPLGSILSTGPVKNVNFDINLIYTFVNVPINKALGVNLL